MNPNDDPTPDLYEIFDKAHMTASHFLKADKSMAKLVNDMRTDLALQLRSYMTRYGQQQYNLGFQKGKHDVSKNK